MIIVRVSWLKYLFTVPGLYVLYVVGAHGRWDIAYRGVFICVFGYLAGYGVERLMRYLTARQTER